MDNILDKATGNMWTLATIFAQSPGYSSIPTNASLKHSAVLLENKYRKYTYIYDGNDLYFGSLFDYAYSYKFKEYLNIPGYAVLEGEYTPIQSWRTAYFYDADEMAYRWYGSGGYTDTIISYTYENQDAKLTTVVDSMFQ